MSTADSTEQTMYSWVRQMINWKESGFREGCSTWRCGVIIVSDNCWLPLFVGMFVVLILPTQVTACTCSKVAARSNKQQFWDKIRTSAMPTSAWIHYGTQM